MRRSRSTSLNPGRKELPLERFAYTEIEVRRPERELKIEPHLASAIAKPGDLVRGDVRATSDGKPVADVDLVVFAVDDAVLTLGDWKLPAIIEKFYPKNLFAVRTYQALQGYIDNLAKLSLTQKGFIIGGGRRRGGDVQRQKCAERISHPGLLARQLENRRRRQNDF